MFLTFNTINEPEPEKNNSNNVTFSDFFGIGKAVDSIASNFGKAAESLASSFGKVLEKLQSDKLSAGITFVIIIIVIFLIFICVIQKINPLEANLITFWVAIFMLILIAPFIVLEIKKELMRMKK